MLTFLKMICFNDVFIFKTVSPCPVKPHICGWSSTRDKWVTGLQKGCIQIWVISKRIWEIKRECQDLLVSNNKCKCKCFCLVGSISRRRTGSTSSGSLQDTPQLPERWHELWGFCHAGDARECCYGKDDFPNIPKQYNINTSKKSLQNLRWEMAEQLLQGSGILQIIELVCLALLIHLLKYLYVCVCVYTYVCVSVGLCVCVFSVSKDDFCSFCGSRNRPNAAANPIWVRVMFNGYLTLINTLNHWQLWVKLWL